MVHQQFSDHPGLALWTGRLILQQTVIIGHTWMIMLRKLSRLWFVLNSVERDYV